MKKMYETPRVEIEEIRVEQGFAASASTIENPNEVDESPDYWN